MPLRYSAFSDLCWGLGPLAADGDTAPDDLDTSLQSADGSTGLAALGRPRRFSRCWPALRARSNDNKQLRPRRRQVEPGRAAPSGPTRLNIGVEDPAKLPMPDDPLAADGDTGAPAVARFQVSSASARDK